MKKIISILFISLISFFSFAQSISYLTMEDQIEYKNKPLFIINTTCDVKDVNGKIVREKTPRTTNTWIDWDKKIRKSISYNNLNHPCSYSEDYFNNDGLIVKNIHKSFYGENSYVYEYSSDYSNFTQYKVKDTEKEKYIYGEYVKENDSYVYYEYEYEDGEITNAYKITGPGLSGSLKKHPLNATQDNPLIRYIYEDGELTGIRTTYENDLNEYETSYSENNDPVFYHRIYDKNKNVIYSKSTATWGGEYKYTYSFDVFGNTTLYTSYEINNDFGIEYLKPRYSVEYEYFYAPDSRIFEPSIPEIVYSYFEEPGDPTPVPDEEKSSSIPITSTTNKLWEKAYYVDNFGDYTTTSYLRFKERLNGTFSNSATTNSRLKVQFLIDNPNKMAIKLYEYDYSEVKGSYYDTSSYYIYIKDESGNTHLLTGKNTSDRIEINSSDCLKLNQLLLENTTLKFHITYEGNKSYNFTIENDSSYEEWFSELER